MHSTLQVRAPQHQAVAAFLPSLPGSPTLFAAISEKLLGSASLAAIVTPESLWRRLGAPRNDEGPLPGTPTLALEEETVRGPSQRRGGPGWAPLEDHELLKKVAALQAACPSVCIVASLLPLVSLFDQMAPRRRLLEPLSPQEGVVPVTDRGPSRFVLIPLYRPHDDEEAEEPSECEDMSLLSREDPAGSLSRSRIGDASATAAAAAAREAAAAAAAAAGASCISGSWRQIALEVGALRALEPNARIFVVFVGTRMALTTPQPAPPEPEVDEEAGDVTEEASCKTAAAPGESETTAEPCAASGSAARVGRTTSRNSIRARSKRKHKARSDLLPSLDVLVCELLLLWKVDITYEHNEETAAALLLRLVKTVAATRNLSLLPRGKLRRLAATASDEIAAAQAALAITADVDGVNNETSGAPASEPLAALPRPDALRRLWEAQLLQLPGVSEEVARAVSAAFPIPSVLFARAAAEAAGAEAAAAEPAAADGSPGIQGNSSIKKKRRARIQSATPRLQAELSAIVVPGRCGNRRVGDALAKRILKVFALETDPEAPV